MIQFATFQNFFQMSGYGVYVWSAYAVALIVLAGGLFNVLCRFCHLKKKLRNKV